MNHQEAYHRTLIYDMRKIAVKIMNNTASKKEKKLFRNHLGVIANRIAIKNSNMEFWRQELYDPNHIPDAVDACIIRYLIEIHKVRNV